MTNLVEIQGIIFDFDWWVSLINNPIKIKANNLVEYSFDSLESLRHQACFAGVFSYDWPISVSDFRNNVKSITFFIKNPANIENNIMKEWIEFIRTFPPFGEMAKNQTTNSIIKNKKITVSTEFSAALILSFLSIFRYIQEHPLVVLIWNSLRETNPNISKWALFFLASKISRSFRECQTPKSNSNHELIEFFQKNLEHNHVFDEKKFIKLLTISFSEENVPYNKKHFRPKMSYYWDNPVKHSNMRRS